MSAQAPWSIYDQNGKLIRGGFKSKRDALQSLPPCNRRWYKALPDQEQDEDADVYSRDECIFVYCPRPDECKRKARCEHRRECEK